MPTKRTNNYEQMKEAACYFFAANYILGGGRGQLSDGNLLYLSHAELIKRACMVIGRIIGEDKAATILRFGSWVLDVDSDCPDEDRLMFVTILRGKLARECINKEVHPFSTAKSPTALRVSVFIPPAIAKRHPNYTDPKEFYASNAWKTLRYMVLKNSSGKCSCCGGSAADGAVLHVDHIIPRWIDPSRELDITNMQCLCAICNQGKGALDTTDWRR